MKKIDCFTNQYSLSKTLRFKLIPVGDTLKNFQLNKMLEEDEKRAKSYSKVKKLIDEYHRQYIKSVFSAFTSSGVFDDFLDEINKYQALYYKSNKDDSDKNAMKKSEEAMRKMISKTLTLDDRYKFLSKQKMIKELLPDFLESDEDKKLVEEFNGFATYFSGFFKNRENMYSSEEKSTAISFRCINENLPKFLDNSKVFFSSKIKEKLSDQLEELNKDFNGIYGTKVEDLFSIDYFANVLSQEGIDKYNDIIGGYTCSDGTKVQGLNEYINLYNQVSKKEDRIPKLKPLYKQILGSKDTVSFIPEKFKTDDEVLLAINDFYSERGGGFKSIEETVNGICKLFNDFSDYDTTGIFVKNNLDLTAVCVGVFGYWGAVADAWNNEYDQKKKGKSVGTEKYIEARKKAYKAVESFSLADIQCYGDLSAKEDKCSVTEWFKKSVCEKVTALSENYNKAKALISNPYTQNKRLYNNDEAIETIKNALDSVKELERTIKLLLGTGKEENKDERFYGELFEHLDRLCEIDSLYDKVRNYMTQKPYSTDKIKLNFQNPQFLGGWDRNKESDYSAVLLKKNESYYLAIIDSNNRNVFKGTDYYSDESISGYKKIVYKQIPNVAKYISSKQILPQNPPKDIVDILNKKKADNKSLTTEEIQRFIEYSSNDFLVNYTCLLDEQNNNYFDFKLKKPNEYATINDFFIDVEKQAYSIRYVNVSDEYINSLVCEGKVYLFQIYNKDFSPNKKTNGTPNLHTLYFKMLFDELNLKQKVIVLNGGAEMFYRKASINSKDRIIHPKGNAIENKNRDNSKTDSTFDYDIIKDKRYTVDQFMIHIPITLNFTAEDRSNINLETRKALKNCDDNYVIGIDRGERNLLYICVVNSKGEIVEQFSLNEIINEHNGNRYTTDYHYLLEKREYERKLSRESWKSIEGIKELKEGYISQVVHKICQLVEKYDAVIAMEDLNSGFKRIRGGKFEKSVYQKFEKMLIDKLNYYADKKKEFDEIGSVLHGYQLTNKFESFKSMGKQNGFIFYVPAYLTSKIDPTTGFADLIHPRYESVSTAKDFIERFDDISFNEEENYFEFALDYSKFPRCDADFKKNWTVCTFGERIESFRNPDKNSEWDNRTVNLTDEFKKLFCQNNIDITSDIKDQIMKVSEAKFFKDLIYLIKLTLQMRNSVTGNIDVDYLISPVKNSSGVFYNSNDFLKIENSKLPKNADANGAYNIARKALWAIDEFKKCETEEELKAAKLAITNAQWLQYAQTK